MIDYKPGREIYPDYPALWHLESLGVLEALQNGVTPTTGTKPSRVAIIDTSVAVDHPCLKESINRDLAIDFFSNRLGAFPYLGKDGVTCAMDNLSTDIADTLPATSVLLKELVDRLAPRSAANVNGVAPTTSAAFSNHGTAIAGLVGARPCIADVAAGYQANALSAVQIPLPYAGVDPFSEIVPISTNFDTDPEALIMALLYAEIIDASVILIPRSFPDPFRTVPSLAAEPELLEAITPVSRCAHSEALWNELAELLVAVSMRRPIVAAAGNSQESGGIYPANLADDTNGIISVGAVNAKGQVAGYSTVSGITIMGPSNDGETFDCESVRLDEQYARFLERAAPARNNNSSFSYFEIVSTDVPGRHGYAHSAYEGDEPADGIREFGSYFCRFGGTSASSAIVAGFLSLARSLGKLAADADGAEAKQWLLANSASFHTDYGSFLYPSWSGEVEFPGLAV